MDFLNSLAQIVFNLNEQNIEQSVHQTMNLFDQVYSYSFNILIYSMVYTAFCSQRNEFNIYLCYLQLIQKEEEVIGNNSRIIDDFGKFISKIDSQESYFLLNKLIDQNLIDENIIDNIESLYFVHHTLLTKAEIKNGNYQFSQSLLNNYEELSKNNWELHKQYIEEGHNPNEIAKIIRNDEIEKLQEISSRIKFDFNQTIEPSLYERCDFVNDLDVKLIDYAAFFGSIKCFKYLLMNGAKLDNAFKYAVAGGNIEIIHLCEQNHSSFEDDAYDTAIRFHRNDVLKYIYENKIVEINDLEELGKLCIPYHNYEFFSFLKGKSLKINNNIIIEAAKTGNIFLVKYFLRENRIPKDILAYSTESGNIELVKYILEQKGIDINIGDIILFYMKFVLIILDFIIIFGNYFKYLNQHL